MFGEEWLQRVHRIADAAERKEDGVGGGRMRNEWNSEGDDFYDLEKQKAKF